MHKLALAAGALALSAALTAQSPLTTTFVSNNGGSAGGAVYFDLQVNVGVVITQIDVNLGSTATTVGTIDVYTRQGSYVGSEANLGAWTLACSGPATAVGLDQPTPAVLNAPISLAPGSYGIALAAIGLSHRYTNGTGPNQTYGNAEMTLTAGAALNVAFSGTPFTPRVVNCSIHYRPAAGFASATPYGSGCNFQAVSFYEVFPVTTFDLGTASGTNVIQMIPTGSGYVVNPGPASWFTPVAANIPLADDAISAAQPLPFSFPYPGGSTSSVILESNGNVWLQPPTHTSFICSTSPASLLTRGPVVSAFYDDLDPTATGGGSITFDVDPSGQVVYCTWTAVPIWIATPPSPRPTNTFQVALYNSGIVELRYRAMDSTGSWTSTLTGFSPGASNLDPGSRDLSTSMPFLTATDNRPLALTATGRPRIGGTPMSLGIGNIPSSPVGALVLGLSQYSPGLPLAVVGMPGCYQHASFAASIVTLFTGSTASVGLTIPNLLPLTGLHVYAQAVALDPMANAFGALTSNGIDLKLDQM